MSESKVDDAEVLRPTVLRYAAIDWDDPLANADPALRPPDEMVKQARKVGARRKRLVQGEGGFFMNRSVLPAGFRVPPHTHDHDELMIVLKGGCEFDEGVAALGPDDSIVIPAHYRYGFSCGPDGMEFLTIRRGDAMSAFGA